MSLASLLAQASAARQQRVRQRKGKQSSASRPAPAATAQQVMIEKLAAGVTGLDFTADLNQLLTARQCSLWIVWKGHRGQAYLETPEGPVVLLHGRRDRHDVMATYDGDTAQRLRRIMKQHQVELCLAWRKDRMLLQLINAHVSQTYCLTLTSVGKGRKSRYLNELEQAE